MVVCASRMGWGVVLMLRFFGKCIVIVTLSLDHATHEGRDLARETITIILFSRNKSSTVLAV